MRKLILLVSFLGCYMGLIAQNYRSSTPLPDTTAFYSLNAVYVEVGGVGGIYSLNYERIFWRSDMFKLRGRIGAACYPEFLTDSFLDYPKIVIPFLINISYGKKHNVEFGTGQSIPLWEKRNGKMLGSLVGNFSLGYRFNAIPKGVLFRLAYTPLYYYPAPLFIEHAVGISIGFTF